MPEKMIAQSYKVTFLTPAFLGNADQDAQWRTPPFKALLRQWWRVAYAEAAGFEVSVEAMRREEGLLFGNAWLSHREGSQTVADHCKSRVRLRLGSWAAGKQKTWETVDSVHHPEAGRGGMKMDASLYLGYGPVAPPPRGGPPSPRLKANAAIQSGESSRLGIAAPEGEMRRLSRALALMHGYGTLGGRSRNGWGSLELVPSLETEATTAQQPNASQGLDGTPPTLGLDRALQQTWPQGIGHDADGNPLIWQTMVAGSWQEVMTALAKLKIELRTHFQFPRVKPPHRDPLPRHWLAYPVTNHNVASWDSKFRLPNSLRFKVREEPDKSVRGVIFHMPCLPPPDFQPGRYLQEIKETWREVHDCLDAHLQRIPR